MSHIITNKEELEKLNYYLKYIDIDKLDRDLYEEIIDFIIPKDTSGNYLVGMKIQKQGKGHAAIFSPKYNTIYFRLDNIDNWLYENYNDIDTIYNINDEELKKYLFLFALLHEVEHSYQYLMGKNIVEAPCKLVCRGYSDIVGLLINKYYWIPMPVTLIRRTLSLILYHRKPYEYILERNANLEAFSDILALAQLNGKEKFIKVFNDLVKSLILMGYDKDNKGCMYHTYEGLLMLDKYHIIPKTDISDSYKIRYGLEISTEHREEIMKKYIKK